MDPVVSKITIAGTPEVRHVLGTTLEVTNYAALARRCCELAARPVPTAIEFANTQIVTMRRHEPHFRGITCRFDHFEPDGMPLIWCMNRKGAGLKDRVYGPTFMRILLCETPAPFTHYILGGSEEVGRRLLKSVQEWNPQIRVAGSYHGKCNLNGELADAAVLEEINRLSPDFIWVAFGTPKQQAWIHHNKSRIRRGLLLSVGFALDVNAGTKPDAPAWMQRLGLGWLFRLASEPGRLGPRYLKYNSLFLFYLFWDCLRGRVFAPPSDSPK
ncbi:MAG: N-acetylglucosaminyldiphosphoundecaprenol N-acetyl-beta-D-mannosaminyltransferase [Verrucomicrobiota bacterium]|jgi:N-acetylglucosaminyldiphosphoundecaprenol N-acetyl-beta-D-mannosaminyltransferase